MYQMKSTDISMVTTIEMYLKRAKLHSMNLVSFFIIDFQRSKDRFILKKMKPLSFAI